MDGGGRLSAAAGWALLVAGWAAARLGVAAGADWLLALPLLLGVICTLAAWRFRRHRLALAAVLLMVGGALLNGLLDGGPPGVADGAGRALLALLLPLNLAALAPGRDRSLTDPAAIVHLGVIALQLLVGATVLALNGRAGVAPVVPRELVALLTAPQTGAVVVLTALVGVLLVFLLRREPFEGALLAITAAGWLAATAPDESAAWILAAAQFALLVSLGELAYRLAFHDALTGLPGRRALEEALRELHGTYAVAMVDVDRFKAFNDRWGHDVGDQVLRMVAGRLGRAEGGHAYRFGGEEFALVFPGVGRDDALRRVEAVRAAVAHEPFVLRGDDRPKRRPRQPQGGRRRPGMRVTVSAGVAAPGAKASTPDEVLAAADRALLAAKRAGRDRVQAA